MARTTPPVVGIETIRALGAIADPQSPPGPDVTAALGLPALDPADATEVFVLSCPPYASIHLGEEGKLGGDAADRIAGFWRVVGLDPPPEPDHLSVLLSLYAELGDAAASARRDVVARRLERARDVLLWEHLWSWIPGYLDAVTDLRTATVTPWARLVAQVLTAEGRHATPAPGLPLALRQATRPVEAGTTEQLLDGILAPVRSGMVLTRSALAGASRCVGIGYRQGERRFTLRSMLEQDPHGTVTWLADEAARWTARHRTRLPVPGDGCATWWSTRASTTATVLHDLVAGQPPDTGGSTATSSPSPTTVDRSAGDPFTQIRHVGNRRAKPAPNALDASSSTSPTV